MPLEKHLYGKRGIGGKWLLERKNQVVRLAGFPRGGPTRGTVSIDDVGSLGPSSANADFAVSVGRVDDLPFLTLCRDRELAQEKVPFPSLVITCLLYTSDAADE